MKQLINGLEGFEKDSRNKALLSTDLTALQSYKQARQNRRNQEQRLNKVENDLSEIKSLLTQIVKQIG
tara:strand:- start:1920 stop:2123 length:204 start_codon:yes stop_codon:yes gene_type:complete